MSLALTVPVLKVSLKDEDFVVIKVYGSTIALSCLVKDVYGAETGSEVSLTGG